MQHQSGHGRGSKKGRSPPGTFRSAPRYSIRRTLTCGASRGHTAPRSAVACIRIRLTACRAVMRSSVCQHRLPGRETVLSHSNATQIQYHGSEFRMGASLEVSFPGLIHNISAPDAGRSISGVYLPVQSRAVAKQRPAQGTVRCGGPRLSLRRGLIQSRAGRMCCD